MQKYYRFAFTIILLIIVQLACSMPAALISLPPEEVTPHLISRTRPDDWMGWIRKLSGEEGVIINGQPAVISSRYNYAMFTGQDNARAFDYLLEQVYSMVPADQVEIDPYTYTDAERSYTWQNIIVTLPGKSRPQEIVILSAHYDSIVVREGDPLIYAPGADDNATGTAALLEGLRLLKDYNYERTIRIVFFSGEEHSLAGSDAYTDDHDMSSVVGVVNLDMFGYDSNNDRCFEIHAGNLPGSDAIGQAMISSIVRYNLNLHFDYLTAAATDRSDHASFWVDGVPAITVIENFFDNGLPSGCAGVDGNPHYHKPADTVANINVGTGFSIMQAALATISDLAIPMESDLAVP